MKQEQIDSILTKDFLKKEYSENHKSAPQIAKEIGCGSRSVYKRLEKYNISRRKGGTYEGIQPGYKQHWIEVLEKAGKNQKNLIIWKCKCKCGNIFIIPTSQLLRGVKSCGCYRTRLKNHRWKGNGEVSKAYYSKIRSRSIKKGIYFNITIQYLSDLYNNQKGRCYFSNLKINTSNMSLDRLDPNKGYTIDNVAWVLKEINFMKHKLSEKEFINLCKLVSKNNDTSI